MFYRWAITGNPDRRAGRLGCGRQRLAAAGERLRAVLVQAGASTCVRVRNAAPESSVRTAANAPSTTSGAASLLLTAGRWLQTLLLGSFFRGESF